MVSGINRELIRVTNLQKKLPTKKRGKSKAAFPRVAVSDPCQLSFSYLLGVPLAAVIGLAFGGRGRGYRSRHQPVCLQRWRA